MLGDLIDTIVALLTGVIVVAFYLGAAWLTWWTFVAIVAGVCTLIRRIAR